jgi:hypothetical protein
VRGVITLSTLADYCVSLITVTGSKRALAAARRMMCTAGWPCTGWLLLQCVQHAPVLQIQAMGDIVCSILGIWLRAAAAGAARAVHLCCPILQYGAGPARETMLCDMQRRPSLRQQSATASLQPAAC